MNDDGDATKRMDPMAKNFKTLRDKMSPARQAANRARTLKILAEMPLNDLRRAHKLTQATIANTMDRSQGEVSLLERRTDCYVSTLRSYIEAMGGELDIVARFPGGDPVKISQFSDLKTGTDG